MRFLFIALLLFSFVPGAGAQQVDAQAEQKILNLLNMARARQGLTSLKLDPKLQEAARAHSQLMAQKNNLSHQIGDEPVFSRRLENAGARFSTAGENVAFDQTAEGAHQTLMNSPPHRANILNPKFNAVGIGAVRSGENLWVTEDFAREYEKLSAQQARDRVFAAFQQARRDAGGPAVKFINEPHLQTIACNMANSGQLAVRDVLSLPGVVTATAYSDSDLASLPSTAHKLAANPGVHRIAVGACFGSSAKYPSGMYWVAIAGY